MKVVHLSTCISFYSANLRIQKALTDAGIDSKILELYDIGHYDGVSLIDRPVPFKIYSRIRSQYESVCAKKKCPDITMGPYSRGQVGIDIAGNKDIQDADIINLHWINGFLSIRGIEQLIDTGKPIVWTVHDSWPFTGGCHVRYGCEHYQTGCDECFYFSNSKNKNLSLKILSEKKQSWRNNQITFIAPSNWMKQCIEKSELFNHNHIYNIPNPINTEVFKPSNCKINDGKFHVLFGAVDAVSVPYKGFRFLLEAMKYLVKKNPQIQDELVLDIFGSREISKEILGQFICNNLGFLDSEQALADAYNNADVYVLPTLDDNFPGTILESLSCGTPAVSFNVGGIPDLIDHKVNGYIAKYKDTADLAEGIMYVYNENQNNRLGKAGREKVMNCFDNEIVAKRYIEMYHNILKD